MINIFKKEITIHDKDGNRFDLKITNEGCKGNPYFSICSQSGQGEFNPKSDIQQELLDIWNTYHLNGMSAGTKEQEDALKELNNIIDYNIEKYTRTKDNSFGYDETIYIRIGKSNLELDNRLSGKIFYGDYLAGFKSSELGDIYLFKPESFYERCEYLKAKGLYEVEYKGQLYRYGSGWIYKDFPDNFEEDLFNLIDKLIEEEDEYNERKITIEDIDNEEFIEHANEHCQGEVEKLMAACLHEGVSWNGLENVTVNNWGSWDVEGFEYNIYTNEEADEAHLEYIKNLVDDIGFEGFRGGKDIDVSMEMNGDITISKSISIDSNERCYSLAGYDGHEHEIKINDTYYYLYRNN